MLFGEVCFAFLSQHLTEGIEVKVIVVPVYSMRAYGGVEV
jgi:hypothetical protein